MIPDYVIQAALDAQSGEVPGSAWTAPQQPVSMGGQPMQPVSLTGQDVKNAIAGVAPYAQKVWGYLNQPQQPVQAAVPQVAASAAPALQAAPAPPPAVTEQPPAPIPEQPAAPPQTGPSPMSSVLESAIRGSQQVVPGGFRKTGYQLAQEGPAPMPGTDIPQTGPTIQTGVADIDAATFRALSPEQQREYLGRLTSQTTKPLRVGPEPVDMDLFDSLTPEEQQEYQRRLDAQTSTISTGPAGYKKVKVGKGKNARTVTVPVNQEFAPSGEPVRPESPYARASSDLANAEDRALLGEQQAYDDRAANMELLARKYSADEAQANAKVYELEDEQRRRSEYIATELPKLESYLEKRAQVQAMNPVDEYNKSRGFGGRLMNAIALGLSTLGSGLTGAPNIVWEMIQKEIDGEVLKQRQTTEALGQQYMARRQLYADMLGQFRTPELAEQATRYSLETAAAAAAKRLAARAQGDDAINASNALVDQVEAKRAATKKALLEGTQRTLWQDVPGRVVGQQGGIVGLVKQLKLMGVPEKDLAPIVSTIVNKGTEAGAGMVGDVNQGPGDRNEVTAAMFRIGRQVDVPGAFGGGRGYTNDEVEARDARNGMLAAEQMFGNLQELKKLVRTDFRKNPNVMARVQQLAFDNTMVLKTTNKLGVLSDQEYEQVAPMTGKFVTDLMVMPGTDREKILNGIETSLRRGVQKFTGKLYADPMANKKFVPEVRERAVK